MTEISFILIFDTRLEFLYQFNTCLIIVITIAENYVKKFFKEQKKCNADLLRKTEVKITLLLY